MVRCYFLMALDYLSIFSVLINHLKKKWRLEVAGVTSVVMMMVLGVLLPAILSLIYGFHEDFAGVALTYMVIAVFVILALFLINSNLTITRIVYEIKYSIRLLKFMVTCYKNVIKEYKNFIMENHETALGRASYHDLTIISTIFFNIFKMYFYTMDTKLKNPEPYLIDTQEMENLYKSHNFDIFYSQLFFQPDKSDQYTPYEQVLVTILDKVLDRLYKAHWFCAYYNEDIVIGMVKYILSHWYQYAAKFRVESPALKKAV